MHKPEYIYECLLDYCSNTFKIDRISLGLVWTVCQTKRGKNRGTGLAMSPSIPTRTLSWPGTLIGQSLKDIGKQIFQWEPYLSTVAMSAINCSINSEFVPDGKLLNDFSGEGNLSVFEYFLPYTTDQNVVVVGHYPGIESYCQKYGWLVLERTPAKGDMPDPACEFLLPKADWVFLSASTLCNKTFPRLAELAAHAKTVLMGPTVPWLPELRDFNIDYLAGVEIVDNHLLYQTACEGGGVRIFDSAVRYKILPLTEENHLNWLKDKISQAFSKKQSLTISMSQWYTNGNSDRFPQFNELEETNHKLSLLDTCYKTLWDSKQAKNTVSP